MILSTRVFFPRLLAVALVAAVAGACGGSGSPAGPSPGAAVVKGTVNVGSGTAGASSMTAHAPAAAVKVTVVGTTLGTMTDGSGRFNLAGVPTGMVTLRFEGSGIDARLDLGGLTAGQVLTINVSVQGDHAQAEPEPEPSASPTPRPSESPEAEPKETDFKGKVSSVTPPTLVVDGRTVVTSGETRIKSHDRSIALSDIKVGDTVEVEGALQMDGTVLAAKITVESENQGNDGNGENEGGDIQFKGTVDSVTPPTLTVSGRLVQTDSHTRIRSHDQTISLSDVKPGNVVEVEGQASGGAVLAQSINVEDGGDEKD